MARCTLTDLLDSPARRQRNAMIQQHRIMAAPRPYDPATEFFNTATRILAIFLGVILAIFAVLVLVFIVGMSIGKYKSMHGGAALPQSPVVAVAMTAPQVGPSDVVLTLA